MGKTSDKYRGRPRINVTLPSEIIRFIEQRKGAAPRSHFVEQILRAGIREYKKKKGEPHGIGRFL